ncbi:MAG: AF1514 family protein [Pseudomonadota bacterium]
MKTLNASRQHSGETARSRFNAAKALAFSLAESDNELLEPEVVAWSDRSSMTESPVLGGCGGPDGWHHYGVSHEGRLEVIVDSETSFIFAESSQFDSYAHFGPGPFLNLRDRAGREWVCLASSLADPHNPQSPSRSACVPVDEASCEFG